jgi:PrtD family type I secretion system ABC transporter
MNLLNRVKATSWWEWVFLDPAPVRKLLGSILGLSVVVNLLALVQPVFMLHVYDYVLPSQSLSTLGYLVVIACFMIGITAVLEYIRARFLSELALELDLQVRERAFMGSYRRGIQEGKLGQGAFANDIDTLKAFLSGPAFSALVDLPWVPIFLVALAFLSPWLCLVTMAFGGLVVFAAILGERRTRDLIGEASQQQRVASKMAEDIFHGVEAIEAMGYSQSVLGRWVTQVQGVANYTQVANARGSEAQGLIKALRITLQVALLATASILVLTGHLTGGVMIAATIIGARALAPIDQLVGGWKSMAAARSAWTQLSAIIAFENQFRSNPRTRLPKPKADINLVRATVMSPITRAPIIQDVSVAIPAGTHVALVGPSGSGKSTLGRVLVGALRLNHGEYFIDGSDFYTRPREHMGAHTGYLPQTPRLLTGTIAENIRRFGKIDDAGVIAAAEMAGAHPLIMRLPDGYDTVVGQNGWNLSGGQSTLVALATALYGDPALVVMDEPFAHLDAESANRVHEAIAKLKAANVTVVVVAHRPPEVGKAEMVGVMLQGRLTRYGPAKDIMGQILASSSQGAAA